MTKKAQTKTKTEQQNPPIPRFSLSVSWKSNLAKHELSLQKHDGPASEEERVQILMQGLLTASALEWARPSR